LLGTNQWSDSDQVRSFSKKCALDPKEVTPWYEDGPLGGSVWKNTNYICRVKKNQVSGTCLGPDSIWAWTSV